MVFESVEISTPAEESPAVSWPAIAAGAIAALALTLVLLAFGAGMGFSAVSPWGNPGLTANAFQITTGLYLIVVALLASAMGDMSPGGCVQDGSVFIPTKSTSAIQLMACWRGHWPR